jgi:hypothetical protein
MTRAELLARCDSAELSEWLAFDSAFGLGDGHEIVGQICATVGRSFSGAKVEPADFAPIFRPQAAPGSSRVQSPEEMLARMKRFSAAHNKAST